MQKDLNKKPEEVQRSKKAEFTVKSKLGAGTFGSVQKSIWRKDGKIYAIKSIDNVGLMNVDRIQQEANNMLRTSSDYTLQLIDHFHDQNENMYIFIMPICKSGSLTTKMFQKWSFENILLFMYQISQAFIDLSKEQIMHLDLKPDNILIKAPGEYLVCDFGCAKHFVDLQGLSKRFLTLSISMGVGTTEFGAPQLITDCQANKYTDVWSFGVILYKIIYKKHPLIKGICKNYDMTLSSFNPAKIQYYGHEPQFQPIVQMIKNMLIKGKRIRWQQIRLNVFKLIGINHKTVIITNISNFIKYVKNICVLISCLIKYLDLGKQYLQKIANAQPLISQGCTLMIDLVYSMVSALSQGKKKGDFFLFQQTKKRITEQQNIQISNLRKQIQHYVAERSIQPQQDLMATKMNFLVLCQEFIAEVNQMKESIKQKNQNNLQKQDIELLYFIMDKKLSFQFWKVKEILNFIVDQTKKNLDFHRHKHLQKFVTYLIYS